MPMGSEDYKQQNASIGRIVHHQAAGRCQAAIITEVSDAGDGAVTLKVFPSGGIEESPKDVQHDESDRPEGTWHWPERV